MLGFVIVSLVACIVISMTCLIAYEIMRFWRYLPTFTFRPHLRVLVILGPIFLTHMISIWLYAVTYLLVENLTSVGKVVGLGHSIGFNVQSLMDCLYFSAVIYTSLGFGDLVPTEHMRMLSAAEVLNGLILITWTASFTYLAMEKFWTLPHGRNKT